MKKFAAFFVGFTCVMLVTAPLHAAGKKKRGKNSDTSNSTDTPATSSAPPADGAGSSEAPPTIDKNALPSVSLQPFLDSHLDRILAPLGESAFTQPEVIVSMKAAYADGLTAAPATFKIVFQDAEMVCNAMAAAITQRQTAAAALSGSVATHSSETEQPKGGRSYGSQEASSTDSFFAGAQKANWKQSAGTLRQAIVAAYAREREAERLAGPMPAPKAAATAVAPATTPPPATAPAANASEAEPGT